MKKNKTLFYGLLGALAMVLAVSSCNDDFSEEDLLQLQQDLADERNEERMQQALDALDQAGEFYSFTISLNNDDNFVEGASVTLHGQADGDVTQATDANGTTTFSSVRSGGNIITISATGFASALLNVDFPPLEEGVNYEITPDWRYVPLPASTSAIVPLFATDASSGSTATVRGTVTIETDVTNLVSEVPQDVQIIGTVDINETNELNTSGMSISRYAFDNSNDAGFGVAMVDNTTGEYSLTVPASTDGVNIQLEVPNIEASQRIAVGWVDGVQLDRPEFRDIMTSFGPGINYGNVPFIRGAIAIFDDPPTPGTGFTLSNFQRVPAPLFNFDLRRISDNLTAYEDEGAAIVQFTSLGEGYTSSPTVTITDATGSNARAEAYVEFVFGDVTVNTPGTGFAGGELIDMTFIIERLFDDGTTADIVYNSLLVAADANGDIGQTEVSDAVNNAISGGTNGFVLDNPIHVSTLLGAQPTNLGLPADEMAGIRIEFGIGSGTSPTGTPTLSMSRLMGMSVTDQGEDYTLPSFTFSGGGATTQATMDLIAYESQWAFDLDNSNAANYNTLPADIYFEYRVADINPALLSTLGASNDVNSYFDDQLDSSHDFINGGILEPNGSGGLGYIDLIRTYRTTFTAAEAPSVQVADRVSERALAQVDIDNDNGAVTSIAAFNSGQGYAQSFNVTIESSIVGVPGSGALIDLTGGSQIGDQYTWFGASTVLSGGSGYLLNLNRDGQNYFGPTSLTVRTGDIIVRDIRYGTGEPQEDVDGNWNFPPN